MRKKMREIEDRLTVEKSGSGTDRTKFAISTARRTEGTGSGRLGLDGKYKKNNPAS